MEAIRDNIFPEGCDARAYELMKAAIIVAERNLDMDYEDIWKLSKEIYKKWKSLNRGDVGNVNTYAYIQEYAIEYLNEVKENGSHEDL